MLLRSSSAPIPTSLIPHSREPERVLQFSRTRSFASPRQNMADSSDSHSPTKHDNKSYCIPRSNVLQSQHGTKIKESDQVGEPQHETHKTKWKPSIRELFSSSGLDRQVLVEYDEDGGEEKKRDNRGLQTLVVGGGMGSDGGKICGGSGRHGSGWESDKTDAYYQTMIQSNPNNALLLGNYAKFLKEVRGDYPKAEEYLERAILANPGDATVLSIYADLIWQIEKDADRAEGYFDQAVKSAPDDCYVLASYAKFLWEAEEEEDKDQQHQTDNSNVFSGANGHHHFNAYLSVSE